MFARIHSRDVKIIGLALLLAMGVSANSHASIVSYELTPLGNSHYRYEYLIANDGSLGQDRAVSGFDILFDPDLYEPFSLEIVSDVAATAGWDQLLLQGGIGVWPAFDALAASGGLASGEWLGGFAVEFTWLGQGVPGAQPFQIYDPATFEILESEFTRSVPVPPAVLLLGSSIAGLAYFARRRRSLVAANVVS